MMAKYTLATKKQKITSKHKNLGKLYMTWVELHLLSTQKRELRKVKLNWISIQDIPDGDRQKYVSEQVHRHIQALDEHNSVTQKLTELSYVITFIEVEM